MGNITADTNIDTMATKTYQMATNAKVTAAQTDGGTGPIVLPEIVKQISLVKKNWLQYFLFLCHVGGIRLDLISPCDPFLQGPSCPQPFL